MLLCFFSVLYSVGHESLTGLRVRLNSQAGKSPCEGCGICTCSLLNNCTAEEESFEGCAIFILSEELLRMEKLRSFKYLMDRGFLNYLIAYYKRWYKMA